MLAQAIEESAWEGFEDHAGMPGVRPIAAAQPAFDEAAEEYDTTHPPAREPGTRSSACEG